MKEYTKDTSKDYEDLVGYIAEENIRTDLSEFLGEEREYKPEIKEKYVDPEFKEDWQYLYVNFRCEKDYIEFMELIGRKPIPRLKEFIYEDEDDVGLMKFLGE